MKKILKMGSAFIGIIVGAGFASGREIVQYFTSFGLLGIIGAIIATALFAYLGMTLTRLGSRMRTKSHKEVVYKISGRYLGIIVDYIIIFTLFGVGVVMIAGAGANLNQQFGLPSFLGSLLMVILVMLTVMLNVEKVVAVIGSITPFLVLTVIIVAVYCLATMGESFTALNPIALDLETSLPNWFISAINYVSFNIAVGASMAIVMGGAEEDERVAAWGGLVGGLGIGVLIILSNLAIYSKVEEVANLNLPMLGLVNSISPIFGIVMAFILFGMIFNTAVSMFYAFGARFIPIGTGKFKMFVFITLVVGFVASFVGFTDLVAIFYPTIGYLGLFLVVALIFASFRLPDKVDR
ncbi:YkvI family membrane protein [Sporosarcina sp. FA9]|uniref:YkvI family membrane protein n=1 Tax=Sporosarcina sp. FA9 TaxID=3413030 RepID=UPI003F66077C